MDILIRDMQAEDERFVGTCSHVGEAECEASCARRIPWLRAQHAYGLRVKVARLYGRLVGFLYAAPSEIAPWGPVGPDLLAIQCLWVLKDAGKRGVGRRLVEAAEEEARRQARKGVAVLAYYHDHWFMPAPFFEKLGYACLKKRDRAAVLWKVFDATAQPPNLLEPVYNFAPVPGKVAVDLFWGCACVTTDIEAQNVREVCAEFGDAVVLREFRTDDSEIRDRYGIFRRVAIDGKEVYWGYSAPKEGLREAIRNARASQVGT